MARKSKSEETMNEEAQANEDEAAQDPVRVAIKAAFDNGIADGLSEDQIKIAMIQAGSTFKGVSKDYAEFQVISGFIDCKEVKDDKIAAILKDRDVSTEESFNEAVRLICEAVKGVNEKSAAGSIRYYTRKAELPCYAKPKGEATGRKGFANVFYDMLIANPMMSKDEVAAVVNGTDGHPETSENTKRYMTHYQNIRKLANAIAGKVDIEDEDDDDEGADTAHDQ